MTTITAYAISLNLNLAAARCPCDLDRGRPASARSANVCAPWRTPCWPMMIGVCLRITGRCAVCWTRGDGSRGETV